MQNIVNQIHNIVDVELVGNINYKKTMEVACQMTRMPVIQEIVTDRMWYYVGSTRFRHWFITHIDGLETIIGSQRTGDDVFSEHISSFSSEGPFGRKYREILEAVAS